MLRQRSSQGSVFSSVSFTGRGVNDNTGPVLQNIEQLPLEHEFTFGKVNRESQGLLDLEAQRLSS